MKVLWLCGSPALGAEQLGAPESLGGGWAAALANRLTEHGEIELTVAFPWDTPAIRRIAVGAHACVPFPRYPRGGRLRRLVHDQSCRLEPEDEAARLLEVVETAQPDLIHVWGTESFFGLVTERCEPPVLIELQGLRVACSEAYLTGLSKLDLLRFGSPRRLFGGRSLLHRYYRYRRSAEREGRILRSARFVSGRTDWDRAVSSVLAPAARYFHCDRVLRPAFYGPRWRWREHAGPVRLVSTLRGNAYKGIETASRCLDLLARLLPQGVEWTLIGIRPGEEVQRIVERKLDVSLAQQGMRLVGRQPAAEVVRRLLESDLFVLTSRIENSPNGLCEAMMLGLPVVSTNVGGIPSLVDDSREGLLVPPGDRWAMAGAIQRLARDPELARSLGAAARRRAALRHEPQRVVAELFEIYGQVRSAGPRGRRLSPTLG